MALRCPFADYRPLGTQTEPAMTGHDLLLLHTMVGGLYGTDRYFHTDGYSGNESHYGLGGRWGLDADKHLDGVLYQWQDRARQADANVEANPRAISVETGDNAPARAADILPWTDRQQTMLVELLRWESSKAAHAGCPASWTCHAEGIPLVLVPDSKPGRRGVGYHRQGIDPWRVAGGQTWSTVYGKECPGPARIRQIPGLIDRARSGGQEADMTPEEHDALMRIDARTSQLVVFGQTSVDATVEALFGHLRRIEANSKASLDKDTAILGALTVIPTTGMTDAQVGELAERLAGRLPSLSPDMILDALTTRLAS